MRTNDVLRIMADLHTFDSSDIVSALDCSNSTAADILAGWTKRGIIVRVRVGHSFLYTLSESALRRVERLPAIDLEERCLLLEMCQHTDTFTHVWIAPDDIVMTQYICRDCGEIVRWTERQNWYRGCSWASPEEKERKL